MSLQKNLRRLRKKRKLSQKRVGYFNGMTRSTYANYENGVAEPNISTLVKLSKFFEITVDGLIK